jgi:hypothetical protein
VAERDDDFSFLIASAQRSIAQQRGRHADLLAKPGQKRGRGLVAHVNETLSAIDAHLKKSEDRFATATNDVERDTVLGTLRLLNGFLSRLRQANTWVEAASSQRLATGALHLLDETAVMLVGSDCDVVTVPSDEYRYATTWAPFSSTLRQLGAASPSPVFPIVVFFPSQERSSLLLEPLLIHELGHSAVARKALVDRVLAHRVGRQRFDRAFSAAATHLARATSASRAAAKILLERQLRQWLTEYLCDCIAVAIAGPAYAYAFAAVVSAESSVELQESHPPTALRVRLILEHLKALGWNDLMQARAPGVGAWLEHLSSADVAAADARHQFMLDATAQFVAPIRNEILTVLGAKAFAVGQFEVLQDELDSFLEHRILPAQLRAGAPTNRPSVVLAGWLHVLAGGSAEGSEGDAPQSIPIGLANWEFGMFLDKAVEMSSVLEAWRAG